MVRDTKRGISAKPREKRERQDASETLQGRIAALRTVPREQLADAVFMLSMEAKRQSEVARQAARQRADVEIAPGSSQAADWAVFLAADAVSTLRHHSGDLAGVLDALLQRRRATRFTVEPEEAIALLAAMLREQRLEGILEGLRLAGLLNVSAKDRHGGAGRWGPAEAESAIPSATRRDR